MLKQLEDVTGNKFTKRWESLQCRQTGLQNRRSKQSEIFIWLFSAIFYASAEIHKSVLYERMHVHLKHLPRGNCNLAMLHLPPSHSYQSRYCELLQVVRLDKGQQAHLPPKCEQNLRIPSLTRYRRSMIEKRKPFLVITFLRQTPKKKFTRWRHNVCYRW